MCCFLVENPRRLHRTRQRWIYDLRTNRHFTLKANPLKHQDLEEFIKLYNPENRFARKVLGRRTIPKVAGVLTITKS